MADRQPQLSVIIVNVNTRDLLAACLESVAKQDVSDTVEVIVVENGSTDGSTEMVRQSFPFCKLIRLDETIGFGAANNVGAKSSTAPMLLFLNSDTEVHAGALGELLSALQDRPECGVAGGLISDSVGERSASTPTSTGPVTTRLAASTGLRGPTFGSAGGSSSNWEASTSASSCTAKIRISAIAPASWAKGVGTSLLGRSPTTGASLRSHAHARGCSTRHSTISRASTTGHPDSG